MNCEKCDSRMRIEENIKISEKEYKVTYICTMCNNTSIDYLTIL